MDHFRDTGVARKPSLVMRDSLKAAVDIALPQTPARFGRDLFIDKWGSHIDPYTACLVTLDYNYKGHPAQEGVHQGQVASSQTLIQVMLSNYQTVGDGRFGETGFGLYTPADLGPPIRIVAQVDEFADHGSGNHQIYEGIYRRSVPQRYGPLTQIHLRPADFKQWVWTLELKDLYQAYLDRAWPADVAITGSRAYPLRTSVKAAFVMSAYLQRRENSLSQAGLHLALQAGGLPAGQTWNSLTLKQLQAPTRTPGSIKAGRLELYRYTATDIWTFRLRSGSPILLYIPGNSSPIHEFADTTQLQHWVVQQGAAAETRQALASHFADADRTDGTFHAGVMTALEGMAVYPEKHWLSKTAGLFNDDGYWSPADYIGFEESAMGVDPFAQLVLTMKRAAQASVDSIRDDAQVNRDNLSAVVEPIVQWINQFGPLALFVPGGEGLLALAGIIDAGYGLDQVINSETSTARSQGLARTVFGLLNALPLAAEGALRIAEDAKAPGRAGQPSEPVDELPKQDAAPASVPFTPTELPATASRLELLRGIGPSVASLSDETLISIGRVSAVDDDMLRLMHMGRAPTPLLADTISRFRIDQALESLAEDTDRAALFNDRYQALQHTDNAWVGLFQQQYPGLPKSAVEQMLDRYGVDLQSVPDALQARQLFSRLDAKARQYVQHVRLNRAYEGLYLRSINNPESDTLALHSLPNLPGWPKGLRVDVLDGSLNGRLLDRCGPLQATDVRHLLKTDRGYAVADASAATGFHAALLDLLSGPERATLALSGADSLDVLKRYIAERALSRSDLMTGLGRMDGGLSFESAGLRGGGFPSTAQGEAMSRQMMRLQVQAIYPGFSPDEADELLQRLGNGAQVHIDLLNLQLQQLYSDLHAWIDQVALDIADMDVPFLVAGDQAAQGMTAQQMAVHNAEQVQAVMRAERDTRTELAVELMSIWQKHPPQESRVYAGEQLVGYRMDMAFEEYHCLPVLNVRLNEVVELSMRHIRITESASLSAFLESFPNLRTLDLEDVDLSEFRVLNHENQLVRALPASITQLHDLTSLNLRGCELTFNDRAASQLSGMTRLQDLDLSDNPLEVPPLLLGMNDLRRLNLQNCGIATCPIGISDQPHMTLLDLRGNRITRLPQNIIDQGIATGRVWVSGNPLSDEHTLRQLISHRQRTGINLWLRTPDPEPGGATAWLRDIEAAQREACLAVWQRVQARPSGPRFLRTMEGANLTPDFLVNYPELQARVWRLLGEADASDELWIRLSQDVEVAEDDAENPMAIFTALENRAKLYRDWVAMGRPFPIPAN